MKSKVQHSSKIEKQVNRVFKSRADNLKSIASKVRVPKQNHFSISSKIKSK